MSCDEKRRSTEMMELYCRSIQPQDTATLLSYVQQLSGETKSYFAPHPFDQETVQKVCAGAYPRCKAFVAMESTTIVAYAIVREGLSEGEMFRFPGYGITYDAENDYLLAPSVADAHQGKGIGSQLLHFVEETVLKSGALRLVLWGGVQQRNQTAVRYYEKNGFQVVGTFHHEGLDNLDMMKSL